MNVCNDPIAVEFTETREDGAGTVRLIASTLKQKVRLFDHFKLFSMEDPTQMIAMAEALQSPEPYVHELTSPPMNTGEEKTFCGSKNKGWFLETVTLDLEWTEPYFKLLNHRTGYVGTGLLPDMDLTGADGWQNICHTHFTKSRQIVQGHFVAEYVDQSSDWDGRKAADRAPNACLRHAKYDVGVTLHEPEYIECGNLFRRNPNYATGREKWSTGVHSEEIWWAICDWWLNHHANDTQRALVQRSHEINSKNHRGVSDLHNHRGYGNLRWSWHHHEVKWEDFHTITEFDFDQPKHY